MFRGVLVCLASGASGQCPDCSFDVTALEVFSTNFQLVQVEQSDDGATRTTGPLPPMLPSDHGSLAVDAHNLYVKLDSHAQMPTPFPFQLDGMDLSGANFHEELHIDGAAGKASYHLEGPMLNGCILVDLPSELMGQISAVQSQVDPMLQQAEAMGPMLIQQMGLPVTVNGEMGVLVADPTNPNPPEQMIFSQPDTHPLLVSFTPPPEIAAMLGPMILGAQFSGYSASAGDEAIRACEIEGHNAMQSFLSSTPDARALVRSRVAQHQLILQKSLQPKSLNMRFNFSPLELVELLVPAEQQHGDELAATPSSGVSVSFSVVSGIFFFSMGMAVYHGLTSRKKVALADQVSA